MAEYCTCDTDYCLTHRPAMEDIRGRLKSIIRRLEKLEGTVYSVPGLSVKNQQSKDEGGVIRGVLYFSSALCNICRTLKPFHTEGCDRIHQELEDAQSHAENLEESLTKMEHRLKLSNDLASHLNSRLGEAHEEIKFRGEEFRRRGEEFNRMVVQRNEAQGMLARRVQEVKERDRKIEGLAAQVKALRETLETEEKASTVAAQNNWTLNLGLFSAKRRAALKLLE